MSLRLELDGRTLSVSCLWRWEIQRSKAFNGILHQSAEVECRSHRQDVGPLSSCLSLSTLFSTRILVRIVTCSINIGSRAEN